MIFIFEKVIFSDLVIDGLSFSYEMALRWLSLDIISGNGLVPSGNKPLTEPMLMQICVMIWAPSGHNELMVSQ